MTLRIWHYALAVEVPPDRLEEATEIRLLPDKDPDAPPLLEIRTARHVYSFAPGTGEPRLLTRRKLRK